MTEGLPRWAQEIIERVVAVCERDPRILGVTVGGSAATGTMDEFSDLDFVVVCGEKSHREVLGGARELAASVGPLLACFVGEHVCEPRLLICLYGPPLRHVDLKFVALSDLATRVEDGRLLWDRDGMVGDEQRESTAVWPPPDGQWIEDRFWVWVHGR